MLFGLNEHYSSTLCCTRPWPPGKYEYEPNGAELVQYYTVSDTFLKDEYEGRLLVPKLGILLGNNTISVSAYIA